MTDGVMAPLFCAHRVLWIKSGIGGSLGERLSHCISILCMQSIGDKELYWGYGYRLCHGTSLLCTQNVVDKEWYLGTE